MIKEIREKHGLNKTQLAEISGIPYRTIQNWEAGIRKCPDYVERLLEFYLDHSQNKQQMYNVYLANGLDHMIVFRGEKEEAFNQLESLRKECRRVDPDGATMDCYIRSDEEEKKIEEANALYETLTEAEKKDYIVVDGKKYIRKIYEERHK